MEKQNIFFGILVGALVIVALVQAGSGAALPSLGSTTTKLMDVTGTATIEQEPDIVTIHISVETIASTAEISQQDNANKTSSVVSALEEMGISRDSIKTTNYRVYPVGKWNNGQYVITGYKTLNTIKVTTNKTDDAGEIIDTAISAGANNIDGVIFGFSKEKREELRMEALKLAGENAREKADSIASGLGVKVVSIKSVSTPDVVYHNYVLPNDMFGAVAAAGNTEHTEIIQGNLSFSATVKVTFVFA